MVKLLALLASLCFDELLGNIGQIAHTTLHDSLHEAESLLGRPLLGNKGELQTVVDKVLAVGLVLQPLLRFALGVAVQAVDDLRLARHVLDFDRFLNIALANHAG